MQEQPMGLTMNERKAVTNELAKRYQNASKGERGRLLKEFIQLTGYARCYASHILHNWGARHIRIVDGERVEVVIGARQAKPAHRRKPRHYDQAVVTVLEKIWAIADGLCGKRLRAFIDIALPTLERYGELRFPDPAIRTKLLSISPATIDRLLAPTRRRVWDKERSSTKPGTLLKHQIPIRTFADWNEKMPGFLEIDLVAHDGGSAYGDFIQSLDATDIATAWTETGAVKNKAQRHVFVTLKRLRSQFPFPILGLDSDNGGEFINNELLRYSIAERISFTRSRPYRKNDNCFVEQKNYSIVRRTTGYYRYENEQQLALLEEIYRHLRLYTNFFLPVMKLVSKTRTGSTVHKHYDLPQTPFQRVLAQPLIPTQIKDQLSAQFELLNPALLKRTLAQLQHDLFRSHCPLPQRHFHHHSASLAHPWRQTDSRCSDIVSPSGSLDSRRKKKDTPSLKQSSHPP
jgi:hypothetical protein